MPFAIRTCLVPVIFVTLVFTFFATSGTRLLATVQKGEIVALDDDNAGTQRTAPHVGDKLSVVTGHAYIRDNAGRIIRTLTRSTEVTVLAISGGQLKVRYRTTEGLVNPLQLAPMPAYRMPNGTKAEQRQIQDAWLLHQEALELEGEDNHAIGITKLKRAAALVEKVMPNSGTLAFVLSEIAFKAYLLGENEAARENINRAKGMLSKSKLANNTFLQAELASVSSVITYDSNPNAAQQELLDILPACRKTFGNDHAETAVLVFILAEYKFGAADYQGALELYEQCLGSYEKAFGKDSEDFLSLVVQHARAKGLSELGSKLNIQYLFKARAALKKLTAMLGEDHSAVISAKIKLNSIYLYAGKPIQAKDHIESVIERLDANDSTSQDIKIWAYSELDLSLYEEEHKTKRISVVRKIINLMEEETGLEEQIDFYQKELTNLQLAQTGVGPEQMLIVNSDCTIIDGKTQVPTKIGTGTRLWAIRAKDGWLRVLFPGSTTQEGWIYGKNVTSVEAQAMLDIGAASNPQKIQKLQGMMQRLAGAMPLFDKPSLTRQENDAAMALMDELTLGIDDTVGQNVFTANFITQLAGMYSQLGQFAKAHQHLTHAKKIFADQLGADHPSYAIALNRLADLAAASGDYQKAKAIYMSARGICEKTMGRRSAAVEGLNTAIATIELQLGEQSSAKQIAESVLERSTKAGLPNAGYCASAHQTLCFCALRVDQPEKAMAHLLKAIEINKQSQRIDLSTSMQLNAQVGMLQAKLGQYETAITTLSDVKRVAAESLGSHHTLVAAIDSFLGCAYGAMGEAQKAAQLIDLAIEKTEKATSKDHFSIASLLAQKAGQLYRTDQLPKAMDAVDRAREITNRYVREVLSDMPPEAQATFLEFNDRKRRDAALTLALDHSNDQSVIERTANWMLNSKGIAVETAAANESLRKTLNSEYSLQQFEKWRALRRQISTFQLEGTTLKAIRSRRLDLRKLKSTERRLRQKISEDFEAQYDSQRTETIDLAAIKARVPADGVLIEIMRIKPLRLDQLLTNTESRSDRFIAWIIFPDETKTRFVDLGEAKAIDALVATLQKALFAAERDLTRDDVTARDIFDSNADLRDALQPIHDQVWKKLASQTNGAKKFVLSPDGNLWLIPWAALPVADERYLVEEAEIRLVNSGRTLLQPKESVSTGPPVLMASPSYDLGPLKIEDALRSLQRDIPLTRAVKFNGQVGYAGPLPGTRAEAKAVEKKLQNSTAGKPEIYLEDQAAEGVFKSLKRPHTLLMSTHGFVIGRDQSDSSNPLLRCGLMLAGCNRRDTAPAQIAQTYADDGVLTGAEIVGTDLRSTELVVLSACQTGLGDVRDGEGVAGLRQAFQLAGADSVIATLWKIPDIETKDLMVGLFERLKNGQNTSSSLRTAQVDLIADLRKRDRVANPFYWAAFTITGQE